MLKKNQGTKLKQNVDQTAKQFFPPNLMPGHQLKYNMISFHCSEMISYHFTGIIFSHGFITLISTHNVINKLIKLHYTANISK